MKTVFRQCLWFTAAVLFVICLLFGFTYRTSYIEGDSMSPTYENGEWIISQRMSSLGESWKPEKLDVILISDKEKRLICKRVLGLPGDTIEIRDGNVYINRKNFDDPFGKGKIIYRLVNHEDEQVATKLVNEHIITVPKGHVWIIGDDREDSWYGILPIKNIHSLVVT